MTIKDTLRELMEGDIVGTTISSFTPTVSEEEKTTTTISDETNINEDEEIKLSPKSIRTLFVAHIAEQLVNESIDEDEDLSKYGLMLEGKLTVKGKDWIKKFLPTIYAS